MSVESVYNFPVISSCDKELDKEEVCVLFPVLLLCLHPGVP